MFNQGSVGYCQVMYVNIVTLGIFLHAGHCCSLVLSLGRIVSFFFLKNISLRKRKVGYMSNFGGKKRNVIQNNPRNLKHQAQCTWVPV